MVHSGHFNAIRQAAGLVDYLVVGVNSDEETAYAKGPTVFNQNERADMVRECKWVKEVVIGTPYLLTPEHLDEYNCKYYLHGDDIVILPGGEDLSVRFKAVGRYKEFARTRGVSTTNIVGKLLLNIRENKAVQEEGPTQAVTTKQLSDAFKKKRGSVDQEEIKQADDTFSSMGKAKFLATTQRIMAFANHREPAPGDKIVYLLGGFDLFHPGHV